MALVGSWILSSSYSKDNIGRGDEGEEDVERRELADVSSRG